MWTDLGFSEQLLRDNLGALAGSRPDLARLLEGAGIHGQIRARTDINGTRIFRMFRRHAYRLQETRAELERPLPTIAGLPAAKDELLSGIGLGERLPGLLDALPEDGRLFIHEADPSLIVMALARHDFREALGAGRLLPYLSAGLRVAPLPPLRKIHLHPLMDELLTWERSHLQDRLARQDEEQGNRPTPPRKTAVVLAGELLQEELAQALHAEGLDVYRLDADALTPDQIARELVLLEPKAAFSINFRPELGGLGGRFGFPYVCWEIDPSASTLPMLRRGDRARDACRIYTWRKKRVELFQKVGYENVEFMPLAVEPGKRAPEPAGQEQVPELVFVGSCMREQAREHRALMDELVAAEGADKKAWQRFLAELDLLDAEVARQPCARNYEERLRDLLSSCGIPEWLVTPEGEIDMIVVAGESLASRKRSTIALGLCDRGIVVHGEEAWSEILPAKNYGGPVGHGKSLNRVYANAAINLDMNRLYQSDIVTLRIFEVAACGGFVLTEDSAEVRELFEPDLELGLYRDMDDLKRQVDRWLAAPEERAAAARRLQERVLREHRVDQRVKTMLEGLEKGD